MIEFPHLGGGALAPLVPFLILCGGGLLLVAIDAALRGGKFPWGFATAAIAAGAIVSYAANWPTRPGQTPFGAQFVQDSFGATIGVLVCLATILAALLSSSYLEKMGRSRGEYYALVLFSASGMVLFASTTELLSLFLGLELLSIPVYVLSGYLRTDSKSLEAG
ncbi:MAG: hypothetical protein KC729_13200, partial [Candidatus Eisenbacteria bacterium]|nr:hypothetical protein [Candidatus Eisenbacteria bacterium]